MRVMIIYSSPAPYREKLFQELSIAHDIKLSVYYCAKKVSYRDWQFNQKNYRKIFLSGLDVGQGLLFNPAIIKAIRKERPDLLLIWGWSFPTAILTLLLAKIDDIPSILFSDTALPYYRYSSIKSFVYKKLKQYFVSLPFGFIAQGELSRDFLVSLGADYNRISILPINCIDTLDWANKSQAAQLKKEVIKREANINAEKIILFMGNLEPRKNVGVLLEAFSILRGIMPDCAVLIVGDGPQREMLESHLSEEVRRDVLFTGLQPYERLPEFCGISDCFVLPALADHWPLVLLEALASGLPLVTSERCGSIPELIHGKQNGFAVNPSDPYLMAKTLANVLTMGPAEKEKFKKSAFETVKDYDYQIAAKKLAAMLMKEKELFDMK